ncbi:phage tail protein I [Cupriavidus sp. D384]|uniref:phage tail protein I n=1 Tax=Cupriavidus sp. D384 TaxID=1538095 RepID=UPI0008309E30|nr:phage tail protein I [Cupriavidus sp. D384]
MDRLLPPNATVVERNLAKASAALGDIPAPLRDIIRPESVPLAQLPWLAWHLGIEAWKSDWPEQTRRALVKTAIPIARKNGTASAVREAIAALGRDIVLREWWEATPRGTPGTFELVMTVGERDGDGVTADFVTDALAEIHRTKPVRAHYTFIQSVSKTSATAVAAAIRPTLYRHFTLSEV